MGMARRSRWGGDVLLLLFETEMKVGAVSRQRCCVATRTKSLVDCELHYRLKSLACSSIKGIL